MYRQLSALLTLFALSFDTAYAGEQQYEPLSASVAALMHRSVTDTASPRFAFDDEMDAAVWLADMSTRLRKYIPDEAERHEFLVTVHYEATRAGLDPQLVLAVVHVESAFRRYAISKAGAQGYMQVMPFWVKLIGNQDSHNLFDSRTNLRYGCVILRHYLDIEQGNLFRALGRYNGSLGKARYPNLVRRKWHGKWAYASEEASLRPVSGQPSRKPSRRHEF
ncbi:MAG: lytic transglycosylase domain-containing protein [Betaproteobacteria bacterium]|nr:MAG: lytic transglycosylase domain-containing protein [Betaproteobacteria bacterium]